MRPSLELTGRAPGLLRSPVNPGRGLDARSHRRARPTPDAQDQARRLNAPQEAARRVDQAADVRLAEAKRTSSADRLAGGDEPQRAVQGRGELACGYRVQAGLVVGEAG